MAEGVLRSILQLNSLKPDLQLTEVIQKLLQLGYEIVKVNSMIIVENVTEEHNWIGVIFEKVNDRKQVELNLTSVSFLYFYFFQK